MSLFVNWTIIWFLTTIAAEIIFGRVSHYTTGAIAALIVILLSLQSSAGKAHPFKGGMKGGLAFFLKA